MVPPILVLHAPSAWLPETACRIEREEGGENCPEGFPRGRALDQGLRIEPPPDPREQLIRRWRRTLRLSDRFVATSPRGWGRPYAVPGSSRLRSRTWNC